MTEKNYTIPINEEFEKFEGCPVCGLHKTLEQRSLDYIMGAAMMEPNVRISTNKTGFCADHYSDMLAMNNRLSLALILETHLKEIDTLTSPDSKAGKKEIKESLNALQHIAENCFVCDRISYTMGKYCENIVHLWKKEPTFRERFNRQPEVCFNHTAMLLKYADKELNTKLYGQFAAELFALTRKTLTVVSDEIARYCKSYDYRFSGDDLGEAKYAAEHAIKFLTGDL